MQNKIKHYYSRRKTSEDYEALATLIKKLDLDELRMIGAYSKEVYFRNTLKINL